MDRIYRSVLAIGTASVLCLFGVVSGASAAPAGGVKGDPQPGLKPFNVSAASSQGTAAVEPNGDIVVTYDVDNSTRTFVCVLGRGGHKCLHSVTIAPPGSNSDYDVPEVFAPAANHIVVLQATCCDSNPDGDDLIYTSTDGGATFRSPARVGTIDVDAAALIGSDIVFAANGAGGAQVESVPLTASGPPGSTATPISPESSAVGVGTYHGGALIASELTTDTTDVAFAPSGDNFNSTGSYHSVGSYKNEDLLGISGNALLTVQTTGKQDVLLRMFNGTSFGAAHVVPGHGTGGPQAFGIGQDPSRTVHVFADRAAVYDLVEVSTSSGGARWSAPVNLGNAIANTFFSAALDSHGSGLVLGTTDVGRAYPVLASQNVSFSLKSAKIRRGRSTTGHGKGSPGAAGRAVALQVERSGRWYTVATAHENASGSFTFTIKGTSTGTFHYRAVASDLAGYLLYGYSASRALTVTG